MSKPRKFIEKLNTLETLLGLDFGEKTIGIAVSDRSLTIASPIKTIKRRGDKKDLETLFDIIEEYQVGGLVFGLPLSLNGDENKSTIKVREFIKKIAVLKKINIANDLKLVFKLIKKYEPCYIYYFATPKILFRIVNDKKIVKSYNNYFVKWPIQIIKYAKKYNCNFFYPSTTYNNKSALYSLAKSKAEKEINQLRVDAPIKINEIAIETASELTQKLIGTGINKSSISAIVDDLSKRNGEKYYGN